MNEARASRFGPAEYLAPAGVEKGILIKEEREELAAYMAIPQVVVDAVEAPEATITTQTSRDYSLTIRLERRCSNP